MESFLLRLHKRRIRNEDKEVYGEGGQIDVIYMEKPTNPLVTHLLVLV